jgi:(2R)-sulfolactate sulfo-lyase subunit alpha
MIHFLVHDAADNVGVAVVDLEPDADCIGRNLADNSSLKARAEQAVPLGHKLTLKDFSVRDGVTSAPTSASRTAAPVDNCSLLNIFIPPEVRVSFD